LKAVREKTQITCKSKPIKITADFSTKTLKARGALWRADYEKPMRTGHKQGEMQLSCFS
jgi:hypothetical protein